MSKTLVQPIGQKRLTNVAVVRLKKHGIRFEIACYKNKVLSWRSGVEKDLDEVLQSQTVYSNVSKGILAKSKDLIMAFGSDDHSKICLEILEKGELQVAGKERESQLSNQFRDIATIVMQKTINPETKRPYTISMIERLMHDIHFAVDPHNSSKKQFSESGLASHLNVTDQNIATQLGCKMQKALEVIRELQKQFPIKRSPMRLRLVVPENNATLLIDKLDDWNGSIVSKEGSGNQLSVVCEIDPGSFRECDSMMRNWQGRLEILAVSVHVDEDAHVDDCEDHIATPSSIDRQLPDSVSQLNESMPNQLSVASESTDVRDQPKQQKCNTCNALVDAKEYRDHFKSDWHKHNLKRKTRQLQPLSPEECMADMEVEDSTNDVKDYSF